MRKQIYCPVCNTLASPGYHWTAGNYNGGVCDGSIILMNKIPQDRQALISDMVNDYFDRMPKLSMVRVMDLAKLIKSELETVHSMKENFNSLKDFIRIMSKDRIDNKKDMVTPAWTWARATVLEKR